MSGCKRVGVSVDDGRAVAFQDHQQDVALGIRVLEHFVPARPDEERCVEIRACGAPDRSLSLRGHQIDRYARAIRHVQTLSSRVLELCILHIDVVQKKRKYIVRPIAPAIELLDPQFMRASIDSRCGLITYSGRLVAIAAPSRVLLMPPISVKEER